MSPPRVSLSLAAFAALARGAQIVLFTDAPSGSGAPGGGCARAAPPVAMTSGRLFAYSTACTDVEGRVALALTACGASFATATLWSPVSSAPASPPTCAEPKLAMGAMTGALNACVALPSILAEFFSNAGATGAAAFKFVDLACAAPATATYVSLNASCGDGTPNYFFTMADGACHAMAGFPFAYRAALAGGSPGGAALNVSLFTDTATCASATKLSAWPALPLTGACQASAAGLAARA